MKKAINDNSKIVVYLETESENSIIDEILKSNKNYKFAEVIESLSGEDLTVESGTTYLEMYKLRDIDTGQKFEIIKEYYSKLDDSCEDEILKSVDTEYKCNSNIDFIYISQLKNELVDCNKLKEELEKRGLMEGFNEQKAETEEQDFNIEM